MTRFLAALLAGCATALANPALAQDHSMHSAPPAEKQKPAKPEVSPPTTTATPANDMPMPQGTMEGMGEQPAMDHSGMDHGPAAPTTAAPGAAKAGTDHPVGDAAAPPVPMDHYADRTFPPAEMKRSRDEMMKDSGGQSVGAIFVNIAEYQAHNGRDGYRWDGEAFYGGDISRIWFKSEGEGEFGGRIDSAEVQVLYSHAVDPYFNLQAGVRQDLGPQSRRTYATIGFEGLAPGMFEVEGGVFVSNKGELLARLEGFYDQRITQRLILQPRVELNLSAQDIPENATGDGVVNVELGLRLRYEITRQFAPYGGVSYYRKFGDTARFSRLAGEDVHATSFVAGVRFWF